MNVYDNIADLCQQYDSAYKQYEEQRKAYEKATEEESQLRGEYERALAENMRLAEEVKRVASGERNPEFSFERRERLERETEARVEFQKGDRVAELNAQIRTLKDEIAAIEDKIEGLMRDRRAIMGVMDNCSDNLLSFLKENEKEEKREPKR